MEALYKCFVFPLTKNVNYPASALVQLKVMPT